MRIQSAIVPIVVLAFSFCVCLQAQAEPSVIPVPNPSPIESDSFGRGITGTGDLDGDGRPDLVVGAPGSNLVHVISGSDLSLIRTLTHPDGLEGLNFGFDVSSAGDITGDGVEDLAIGAPGSLFSMPVPCDPLYMDCPRPEDGRVFLFDGSSGFLIRELYPVEGFFFKFGFELANLGDVNGDGIPDLAVGSPVRMPGNGQVYAFSGSNGAQLWMTYEPGDDSDDPRSWQLIASFGQFLAPIGDLDGDGIYDLVVAAPFFDIVPGKDDYFLSGKVFVLSGATGGILRDHLSTTPLDGGYYGGAVSNIGDQDEDGVEDYLIGNPGADTVDLYSGLTGSLLGSIPTPVPPQDITGSFAFARAYDRNGDGKEDFWVGSYLASAAYLLDGMGTVLLEVLDPGTPVAGEGGFGARLSAIPDLDSDGKPEALIAKPGEDWLNMAGPGEAFMVMSNNPPEAHAGEDQQVFAGPNCFATVPLNGTGSSDPDGDALSYTWDGAFGTVTGATPEVSLPPGTNLITLTVDDGSGAADSDTVTITVADTTAPIFNAISASPETLWPANHRMVPVTISVSASDNCTPVVSRIVNVSSNEPANGKGDGNFSPDWLISGDLTVDLRAERSGRGSGRIYSAVVQCSDAYGNLSVGTVLITVPHDIRRR